MIIDAINAVISAIGSILGFVFDLLPDSPFNFANSLDNEIVKAINWLIPFPAMVAHLTAFVLAVAVYYALRIVLRWLKAVGS